MKTELADLARDALESFLLQDYYHTMQAHGVADIDILGDLPEVDDIDISDIDVLFAFPDTLSDTDYSGAIGDRDAAWYTAWEKFEAAFFAAFEHSERLAPWETYWSDNGEFDVFDFARRISDMVRTAVNNDDDLFSAEPSELIAYAIDNDLLDLLPLDTSEAAQENLTDLLSQYNDAN